MKSDQNITSISALLQTITQTTSDREEVTVRDIINKVGQRSFGPILLLAGLVTLAPLIGDIPGVPTIMAAIVFLVAIQMILGQKKLWLPEVLLKQSVQKEKLHSAIEKIKKPAEYIDSMIKPRYALLTNGRMIYPVAVICLCISLATPAMEFIPFSANFAGAALTAFGLSLIANDGLLVLLGYIFTLSIIGFILYMIL